MDVMEVMDDDEMFDEMNEEMFQIYDRLIAARGRDDGYFAV